MRKELDARIHNRFDIEIIDAKTGKVKQKAYAENIILNQAWAQILTQRNYDAKWFSGIAYGTGTGTLEASRTALFSNLSNKTATDGVFNFNAELNTYSLRQKITILESEHNGSVLTEVGIWDTTSSKLMTHALLKDMNGNTVSLTKTNTDIIYIYATVYLRISTSNTKDAAIDVYRCEADYNGLVSGLLGKIIYSGGRYMCETFPSKIHFSEGSAEATLPYKDFGVGDTIYTADLTITYDTANKKVTFYHRVPAASMNVGTGVKTFCMTCSGHEYEKRNPAIRGHFPSAGHTQATITEQIGTGDGATTAFKTAFPFVKSGAVIKVDGVTTEATVIAGVPNRKNIAKYFYNLGKENGYLPAQAAISPPDYRACCPDTVILENPFYETYGIDDMKVAAATIWASDDKINWTLIFTGSWWETYTNVTADHAQTFTVPSEHKHKRYWKAAGITGHSKWAIIEANCTALDALKNVVFSTAPASGAVITAEYNTDVAAKDANHVLDVTVTVQLGEYTP